MAVELFTTLNVSYQDFCSKICFAFGSSERTKNPILALNSEVLVVEKLLSENPATDRIFKRIEGGLKAVTDGIYEKDMQIFKKKPGAERVCLFEYTHLYEIVPRMQAAEMAILWSVLENLSQFTATIAGSSKYMASFTDIAHTFMKANPNATEADTRQLLFSQMLTNPEMLAKTASFFKEGDLCSMPTDFAHILRGYGLTAGKKKPKEEGPTIEEVKDEQPQEEVKVHVNTSKTDGPAGCLGEKPVEPGSLAALFADMANQNKSISEQTEQHRAEKKNPIASMISMMEKKELTSDQLQEMKEIASKTLGGGDTPDRQKMARVFEMFGSNNPNPQDIATELGTTCGSEQETNMFMSMFADLKTSVAPMFAKKTE